MVSFLAVPVVLAAMVVMACQLPALRAARVDPAAVLIARRGSILRLQQQACL